MSSLEDEIAAIRVMTDPVKVKDKKSGRKGQLTKIATQLRTIGGKSFSATTPRDLERKYNEARRSVALFNVLQDRHEELLTEARAENLDDELEAGRATREENNLIIEKAEILMEQMPLYYEGIELVDEFKVLLTTDNIDLPIYQETFRLLHERAIALKMKTRSFASVSDIRANNVEIASSIRNFQLQVAEAQKRAKETTAISTTTNSAFIAEPDVRTVHSPLSRLSLEMPKFSGKVQDWASFKERLTSIMTNHGVGMPDADKCCHLAKCMTTEDTRRIVESVGRGKDGYENALKALKDCVWTSCSDLPYPHTSLSQQRQIHL